MSTDSPSQKKTKKWIARKVYICGITGESCDDGELHPMTDLGPDCESCSVYKKLEKKINGGL